MLDPDAPSCSRCVRFTSGPRYGRVFFRCLRCALEAGRLRDEAARRG